MYLMKMAMMNLMILNSCLLKKIDYNLKTDD